jgi:hypothetical protein
VKSSAEEANLLLKRWQENSTTLRIVLGTHHVQMRLNGTIATVTSDLVWAQGSAVAENLKMSLPGASFVFMDERGLPPLFHRLVPGVDELLSIVWSAGTRLTLLKERSSS